MVAKLGRTVPLVPKRVKTGKHAGKFQLRAKPWYINTVAINTGKTKKEVQKTVTKYKKRHHVTGFLTVMPRKKNVIIRTAEDTNARRAGRKKKKYQDKLRAAAAKPSRRSKAADKRDNTKAVIRIPNPNKQANP